MHTVACFTSAHLQRLYMCHNGKAVIQHNACCVLRDVSVFAAQTRAKFLPNLGRQRKCRKRTCRPHLTVVLCRSQEHHTAASSSLAGSVQPCVDTHKLEVATLNPALNETKAAISTKPDEEYVAVHREKP